MRSNLPKLPKIKLPKPHMVKPVKAKLPQKIKPKLPGQHYNYPGEDQYEWMAPDEFVNHRAGRCGRGWHKFKPSHCRGLSPGFQTQA
jgi:hypothetical protein